MADLVRGRYHTTNPIYALTGGASNVIQPNLTPRSNLEFQLGGTISDQAAALTTAVMTVVPVPVEVGDNFSKVTVLVGGTAASTPVNQWVALYSGTANISSAVLLAQSSDTTSSPIAAGAAYTFSLSSVVSADGNQPNGYLYCAVMVKATTVPSLIVQQVPVVADYHWFTNSPNSFAWTSGSSLTGGAPTTLNAVLASQQYAPIVFLT